MWLVAVLVLGAVVVWQFVAIRGLRDARDMAQAETEQMRVENERLREIPRRREEMVGAGRWLHEFYQSEEGLGRKEGLWFNNQPDFEGIGAWLLDVYLSARIEGASEEDARQRVVDQIQQTDEWRQGHPGQ
jgi:hypothetical protein